MKHLLIPCAALALACSDPNPEDVLRCKAKVFQATEQIPELISAADPTDPSMPMLEQLLSIGMTAAEAQVVLDQLESCLDSEVPL